MSGPRLLVTGFEPFPGAPVNPTEWLVGELRRDPPHIEGVSAFRAEMLPVTYAGVGPRLTAIGRAFEPDIAVHFGLAQECAGFRLERIARNQFLSARPDNEGRAPFDGPICAGEQTIASRLPLKRIHSALSAEGIPAEWSDDAGGYLCNTVFTLSLARGAEHFEPVMSGFVHVPLLSEDASERAFTKGVLLDGVAIILREAVEAYLQNEKSPAEAGLF